VNEWEYHPPPDLDQNLADQLRNFPRQPQMLHYALRLLAAMLLRVWMRIYHRLRIRGRKNLPRGESFVLVCNHTSHLDTLAMLCAIPLSRTHRAFPAAAADYFFSSLPRSAVSAILINALPFDRKAKGAESLAICDALLTNAGNVLILFPEGTRTTSGELGRFRSGIGRLVAGTDIPVLPCYLDGGFRAWPKGKALPKPRRLRLSIGRPQRFVHLPKTAESVREICRELEDSVRHLGSLMG
jgi:1-acyl-sn-glycerol-3-phosphate acyltransferase